MWCPVLSCDVFCWGGVELCCNILEWCGAELGVTC